MAYWKSIIDSVEGSGVVSTVVAVDPHVTWTDPLIGEWWIDTSQCYYDRPLPFPPDPEGWTPHNRKGARPASGAGGIGVGKWAYVPEGEGVRSFYYFGNGPDSGAEPMMQYFATWDGTPWADPQSTLLPGQLAQVWRIDPHFVIRLVLNNKTPLYEKWEWAVWAASTNGRVFACTSWDETAPHRHNLQVFDKHIGPTYNPFGSGAPASMTMQDEEPTPVASDDPILGAWVIVPEQSSFLRGGQDVPNLLPDVISEQRLVFAIEGSGIRQECYATSESLSPLTSVSYHFDGAQFPVPDATGHPESRAVWKFGLEVMVQKARHPDGECEWSIYACSADGTMLSITSWDQQTPQNRDIRVFHKA